MSCIYYWEPYALYVNMSFSCLCCRDGVGCRYHFKESTVCSVCTGIQHGRMFTLIIHIYTIAMIIRWDIYRVNDLINSQTEASVHTWAHTLLFVASVAWGLSVTQDFRSFFPLIHHNRDTIITCSHFIAHLLTRSFTLKSTDQVPRTKQVRSWFQRNVVVL